MNNTILLVEDDQPIRSLLQYALSIEGYETIEAENVKKAWALLDDNHPDLILMDWMLPDASGIDMVEALKNHPETKEIPIIMLTANSSEEQKMQGLNAGADDYMTKPFSPKVLTARIHAILKATLPCNVIKP